MLHTRRPALLALLAASTVWTTARAQEFPGQYYPPPDPPEPPAPAPSAETAPPLPPAPKTFELSARGGFATAPVRGGVNPFGAGIGARAGLLFSGLYVGGTVVYFAGGTDVDAQDQTLLYGLEAGYGIRVSELVQFRPWLGVGNAAVSHTEPNTAKPDVVTTASGSSSAGSPTTTTTVNSIYVQPGISLVLGTPTFFVAAGPSALILPKITYGPPPAAPATWLSWSFEGQAGVRF